MKKPPKPQRVNYTIFSMECLGMDLEWIGRAGADSWSDKSYMEFFLMFPHQIKHGAALDGEAAKKAWATKRLKQHLAEADAARKPLPPAEVEQTIDEAMTAVRPGYRRTGGKG